jgi:hypothetical protein
LILKIGYFKRGVKKNSFKESVEPHAGWCGGWERKTPGYPVGQLLPQLLHKYKLNLRR